MKTTAVIMAGGRGERFWPVSRANHPKQFVSLTNDGKSLLQQTVERLRLLVESEDIFIVTGKDYVGLVKRQLPGIPHCNILCEPMPRNTAPCIGFAAAIIRRKYGEAVMLVLPSDHLIEDNAAYIETLKKAVDAAKSGDHLITIGIVPAYPETGYGYIRFEPDSAAPCGAFPVKRFVEKPDINTAREFLASGQYLWNSGMFAWKLSAIMGRFQALTPELYEGLLVIGSAWGSPVFDGVLEECYAGFKSESIDYGIMEHSGSIFVVPGSFGWDDAGSLLVLERMNQADENGNTLLGDVALADTEGCIIKGGKKLIAAVGLRDLVIVDTGDALLVCDKTQTGKIRELIRKLKDTGRNELL